MGRLVRQRYEINERVRELVMKEGPLSSEEKEVLAEYSGAGGLSQSKSGQFFTPGIVARFVVDLMGIKGGSVLEPSAGAGVFLQYLPETCLVTAVEPDFVGARVIELLYPSASVLPHFLEETNLPSNQFDYVIGNPPYGLTMPEPLPFLGHRRGKSEGWFTLKALELLKPWGVLGLVVPDSLLSTPSWQPLRKWIIENHLLIASISLPAQTFYFTGTSVKTSVLIIQKLPAGVTAPSDHRVFMALATGIGWDTRGRASPKNDLPAIRAEFEAYRKDWHSLVSQLQAQHPLYIKKPSKHDPQVTQLALAI